MRESSGCAALRQTPSSRAETRGRRLTGLAAALVLFAAAAWLIAAPGAQARDSFALGGTYDFEEGFGENGPSMMAVHDATDTLYVVDSSNDRILKFDISDPLDPQPESFSGLGSNELTEADGEPLALIKRSNIAVDNSGGPQDGTIYLATSGAITEAGTMEAHAFSASGEWLYEFRLDEEGNFDPNGANPWPTLAVAVARGGPEPGRIVLVGNSFGSDTAALARGAAPGDPPTVHDRGTTGGFLQTGGAYATAFSADGESFRFIRTALFGSGLNGGENVTVEALAYQGRFVFGGGTNPGYVDAGFSSDGDTIYARNTQDGGRIDAYRQTGYFSFLTGETGTELIGQFGFGQQGSGFGMAETEADYLYLSDTGSGELRIFEPAVAPDVSIEEPGSVDLETAELRGTVNAQGLEITSCEFRWGTTTAYSNPPAACDVTPSGTEDVEVTAEVPVTPRAKYHTVLFVSAANGTATTSSDLEWQAPDLPEAETLPAGPQQRKGTAVLGGTVDPNETPTGYHIEYSTDPGLAESSRFPAEENLPVPSGDEPVRVSVPVTGLDNATTYHFRIVAETKADADAGEIESFTTFEQPSEPQPSNCENAEFRTGFSSVLPDCRAWEQISVRDKNGGQVNQGGIVSSPDGERVTYQASSVFAGARSLGTQTGYIAGRGSDWTTQAMAPATTIPITVITYNLLFQARTPDLSRAAGFGPNVKLPGAEDSNTAAYLWDTEKGENQVIAFGSPSGAGRDVTGVRIADDGMSGALSGDRLQATSGPMVPADQPAVYWWTDTGDGMEIELASLLPNGEPAITPTGSGVGFQAMSSDGAKALWLAMSPQGRSGSQELYVSRRGEPTLWASQAQGIPQPETTPFIFVEGWTPDLRYVYFSTTARLTADSATPGPGVRNLYRFETETSELDDLTSADPEGGGVMGILNLTDDGSQVYFSAKGNLTPDASGAGSKLYGWRDGQTRLITDYGEEFEGYLLRNSNGYELMPRVSQDGRYLLFPFQGDTAGTRMDTVYETNEHQMFYRYDWDEDKLDCVSCDPQGRAATSDAHLTMPVGFRPNGAAQVGGVGRERRFMTEDGRVMFNTAQGLLPADGNNRVDTYIWDGDLRLLTDGSSDYHQWAEDATAGFEDIYALSSQRLVPADMDDATDLFVASIDGGLASQQVRPTPEDDGCQGESCLGNDTAGPELPRIDSERRGGEVAPADRCARQRMAFRRTARAVRTRVVGFRKARRSARVAMARFKRRQSGTNRRAMARNFKSLRRSKVLVKRALPMHRRSKAALARCVRGAS